jgi:NAD(P)-dependent dehydrogenase (short-subunit alcohol dehydrogenase family)
LDRTSRKNLKERGTNKVDLGLKGKTVIVTGGASNIGRAICLTFAREGCNVAIADWDEQQAQKVVNECGSLGAKSIQVKTDVTKLDQVEAMVKRTLDEFKGIDILVNNVGWDQHMLFVESTPDFWDKIIDINYRSMLNCTKVVLPYMIEQRSGAIVSIGSDAGRAGEFRESVYSGTKAAVIALSKAIARENGRYGIRVNVVCPGVTPGKPEEIGEKSLWAEKEVMDSVSPDYLDKVAKNLPLRKVGKAQDVANAVAFLASDCADNITGQTISVSGGYTMI